MTKPLVTGLDATSSGYINGTAKAIAKSFIGGAAQAFVSAGTAVAEVTGVPTAASVAPVLKANSAINTAIGATPSLIAIGEAGGAYSSGGSGSETITDGFAFFVDPAELSSPGDLILGLFGETSSGGATGAVTFGVQANETSLVSESFSSLTAAEAYFTDNPIDLTKLDPGLLTGTGTRIDITLTVTTTAAGQNFYAGFLLADPPPAKAALFAAQMAGMASAQGGSMASAAGWPRNPEPMNLARAMA